MKQCFSLDPKMQKFCNNTLDWLGETEKGMKTVFFFFLFFFFSSIQADEQNSVKDANPQSCLPHMCQLCPDKTAWISKAFPSTWDEKLFNIWWEGRLCNALPRDPAATHNIPPQSVHRRSQERSQTQQQVALKGKYTLRPSKPSLELTRCRWRAS